MDFFSVLFAKTQNPSGTASSKIVEYSTEAVMENSPFSCEISVVCKDGE